MEMSIIDAHESDGDGNTGRDSHLHLVAGALRYRLAVLDEALHNHPHHFLNIMKRLFLGVAPRGRALPDQRRALRIPAVLIRLNDNVEGVCFHGGTIALSV